MKKLNKKKETNNPLMKILKKTTYGEAQTFFKKALTEEKKQEQTRANDLSDKQNN